LETSDKDKKLNITAMKHVASLFWLISWPVLVYVTYRVSLYALKLFEKNMEKSHEQGEAE
jgi:hypothetical protein